jgi:hypothetical protein
MTFSINEFSECDPRKLKLDLRNYFEVNYSFKNEVILTQEWFNKLCNKK